jgi:hypothetical protein
LSSRSSPRRTSASRAPKTVGCQGGSRSTYRNTYDMSCCLLRLAILSRLYGSCVSGRGQETMLKGSARLPVCRTRGWCQGVPTRRNVAAVAVRALPTCHLLATVGVTSDQSNNDWHRSITCTAFVQNTCYISPHPHL